MLSKIFYTVGLVLQSCLIVTVATAAYIYVAEPFEGLRVDLNIVKTFRHAPGAH